MPETSVERAAYEKAKYTTNDIKYLYGLCASVKDGDPYLEPGFRLTEGQQAEVEAALILCPNYPKAEVWKANLALIGQPLTKFVPGDTPLLVGKEVAPGTYVAHDVDGCYWERQNVDGNTIANNFITAAAQVRVSIKSTDYAFVSRGGCGEWAKQ